MSTESSAPRRPRGSPSDQELLAALGRGEIGALELLYRRHRSRVRALCYRMTGDPQLTDDLVQETFLRVLRYGQSYRGGAAFTTWLYRLVRNVCLDHLKRESRLRERSESWATERERMREATSEDDPRIDTLKAALYALEPHKREVLVLSRYEGLSYAEIAEVCETTVGAIKVRAHRALKELRERYQEAQTKALGRSR